MKNITKKLLFLTIGSALTFSCSNFEEINIDPKAANIDQVQVEYFLNGSMIDAQQDPHVAERAFVLYWKTAGRQQRSNGIATGIADDGWSSDYYGGGYMSKWLNSANMAVQTAKSQMEAGTQKPYTNNSLQAARIWRVYLMSELADNFGPIPIEAFQGVNPEFADLKTVYYFLLKELKEASAAIDPSVKVPDNIKKLDAAYGYDYAKWKSYANSMRLRLSMRLSEVDPAKAKEEFEDAVKGNIITDASTMFQIQEKPGWDALTGVMSREWNAQLLSATLNNLYIGLGGISSKDQLPASFHAAIKPANWMGLKFANHITTMTNDPGAGFWFDGLHDVIDPRAYKTFIIPGDFTNADFSNYPTYATDPSVTKRDLLDAAGKSVKQIEAKNTWNAGSLGAWGNKGSQNQVYTFSGTNPRLAQRYRNSLNKRVFFGPWETYFLIAEAGVRGWTVPTPAKEAYEAGIKASFDYVGGVGTRLSTYLNSVSYNRAGTSVSWDHVAEPPASRVMNYADGYTNAAGTMNAIYPKNELYKAGAVKNDRLTKIITQKFIAQTPWLPLETWSDHRRLGLPFFENPAVEIPLPNLPALTSSNYMTSSIKFFPQRLKYPSSLQNSNPAGYEKAKGLLGGEDAVLTPLWWAKH